MKRKQVILNFFMVFIIIVSVFLTRYKYLPIIFSCICLGINFILNRRFLRIFIFIFIISLATIVTNILIIRNSFDDSLDLFSKINILEGMWQYNDGMYEFLGDYTFFDRYNEKDYCTGKYSYSYGGISSNDDIIKQDMNYYYYSLTFKIDYCFSEGIKEIVNEDYDMIFGVKKNDSNDIYFINSYDNYVFKLKKIDM